MLVCIEKKISTLYWVRVIPCVARVLGSFVFLDYYTRSIELGMLWPELDWSLAQRPKISLPSFGGMYWEEDINFILGAGDSSARYSSWFICFLIYCYTRSIVFAMLWPELDWSLAPRPNIDKSFLHGMYWEEDINFLLGSGYSLARYSSWLIGFSRLLY